MKTGWIFHAPSGTTIEIGESYVYQDIGERMFHITQRKPPDFVPEHMTLRESFLEHMIFKTAWLTTVGWRIELT